jgi:hypothetical protein
MSSSLNKITRRIPQKKQDDQNDQQDKSQWYKMMMARRMTKEMGKTS